MALPPPGLPPADPSIDPRAPLIRRLTVAVLFVAVATALYLTAGDYVSLDALRQNQEHLRAFVAEHTVAAALAFMTIFALYAASSIPGVVALTFTGGLLFSPLPATLMVMVAMTVGGTISFLMVRYVFTDFVRARTGTWASRLEAGFRRNMWSYMFILRIMPVVPYFVVNIVPALLRIPARVFIVATFFGTAPNTYVYATLGAGFADALAADPGVDPMAALLQPKIVAALAGLVGLALLPVLYQRFTKP